MTQSDNSDLDGLLGGNWKEIESEFSRTSFANNIYDTVIIPDLNLNGDFVIAATQQSELIPEIRISFDFNKVSAPPAPDIPQIKIPHLDV